MNKSQKPTIEACNLEPESLDEFTDIEDLKNNYAVLKTQRDTYKLLLSNYERIFLHDGDERGLFHNSPKNTSVHQLQGTISPLNGKNVIVPILESSTYSSLEKENKMKISNADLKNLSSKEEVILNEEKNENKEPNVNISDKIEQLNNEIKMLKSVLEDKNDLFQFSEGKIMSEFKMRRNSSAIHDTPHAKLSIDGGLLIKTPQYTEEEIFKPNNNNDDNLEKKEFEDPDKSEDSTSQMQNFFKIMTDKLKFLEERNMNLTSQLQNGLTEKENLLNNIGDLQEQLNKVNKAMEEKNKEYYKIQVENFLEQQDKLQKKKSNICKNLCTLI